MANKRVTELDSATPAVGDKLHIIDISDTTDHADGTSKRTTLQAIADLFKDLAQILTNKILTSPVINTGITGTAIKDEDDMASDSATAVPTQQSVKAYADRRETPNLLKNGNFINNSTDGYGGTPDDWVSSSGNPVQGGIPTLTKAQLISILGIADGDIEGLWPLNEASGNALDLSSSGYDLTDTNTVLSSDDGLMALARDFELDNSEYFTIADASCANLEIAGNQTWFAWIKPETITADQRFMAKANVGTKAFRVVAGKLDLYFGGLTTTNVTSDIVAEAGKWYFVCGIYNSVADTLTVWVNGVKKSVATTGSPTDTDGDFSIGRNGSTAANYFDGLIQNACVLSVALSDDQVKRLWAYTSYKGQKIRRDSTDALLYQDLPQDLVERLRGRTVTLRAKVYAESTNHRIYIYDGTDTTAVSPSGADAWEEISVTATIGADADQIRIGLEADTTDGNMWIKEVSFYEGGDLIPYDHSKEDWNRFPRLLKLDPPAVSTGYEYEEKRMFSFTTTIDGFTVGTTTFRYSINGNICSIFMAAQVGGTSNATNFTMTLPIATSLSSSGGAMVWGQDANALLSTPSSIEFLATNIVNIYKAFYNTVWTNSGAKGIWGNFRYEID